LNGLLDLMLPELGRLDELLRDVPQGLSSPRLGSLAPKLMQLAVEGFARLAPCFQGEGSRTALEIFAQHFTQRLRSPVDDLIDAAGAAGSSAGLDLGVLRRVEQGWNELLARGGG
jgi:hypothetical protein